MKTYAPASHYCIQCDRAGIIIDGICRSCDYDNRQNAYNACPFPTCVLAPTHKGPHMTSPEAWPNHA